MFVRGMQSVHLNINYYIFVQLVPMLYFLGVFFLKWDVMNSPLLQSHLIMMIPIYRCYMVQCQQHMEELPLLLLFNVASLCSIMASQSWKAQYLVSLL